MGEGSQTFKYKTKMGHPKIKLKTTDLYTVGRQEGWIPLSTTLRDSMIYSKINRHLDSVTLYMCIVYSLHVLTTYYINIIIKRSCNPYIL